MVQNVHVPILVEVGRQGIEAVGHVRVAAGVLVVASHALKDAVEGVHLHATGLSTGTNQAHGPWMTVSYHVHPWCAAGGGRARGMGADSMLTVTRGRAWV